MIFPEAEPWVIVWCALALALGGLIKGALGVGTPLLTVPLMAMVLPAQTAVVLMAMPVVVANLWQLGQAEKPALVCKRFWPTFVALLVGIWAGVHTLSTIDERILLISVGIMVIAFGLLQGSSYRLEIPPRLEKPAGAGFGLASGFIGGLSSMFGPMLIIYLTSLGNLGKNQFVSSISFLYVGAVVPWTLVMIYFDVLTMQMLIFSSCAVIPVVIGLIAGRAVRNRISEKRFRSLVLVVVLGSGISMLLRGF